MRKIEQQMLEAIQNQENWRCDNTAVTQYTNSTKGWTNYQHHAHVSLFGNTIAIIDYENDSSVHVNVVTWHDYPTRTTQSRLRALGMPAKTKAGKTFINGNDVTQSNETYYPEIGTTQTKPKPTPAPQETPSYSLFDVRSYS